MLGCVWAKCIYQLPAEQVLCGSIPIVVGVRIAWVETDDLGVVPHRLSVQTLFGQTVGALVVQPRRCRLQGDCRAVVAARLRVVAQLAVAVGASCQHRHVLLTVLDAPDHRASTRDQHFVAATSLLTRQRR